MTPIHRGISSSQVRIVAALGGALLMYVIIRDYKNMYTLLIYFIIPLGLITSIFIRLIKYKYYFIVSTHHKIKNRCLSNNMVCEIFLSIASIVIAIIISPSVLIITIWLNINNYRTLSRILDTDFIYSSADGVSREQTMRPTIGDKVTSAFVQFVSAHRSMIRGKFPFRRI
jgi:hypothetical protein